VSRRPPDLAAEPSTLRIWRAGLAGVPLAFLAADLPRRHCGGWTEEAWSESDGQLARLLYAVLVEDVRCGRCGAALRPRVGSHLRVATMPEATRLVLVVTVRCARRRWHRHDAEVTRRRDGLHFGPMRPAGAERSSTGSDLTYARGEGR
jgi:hypothetical protein